MVLTKSSIHGQLRETDIFQNLTELITQILDIINPTLRSPNTVRKERTPVVSDVIAMEPLRTPHFAPCPIKKPKSIPCCINEPYILPNKFEAYTTEGG